MGDGDTSDSVAARDVEPPKLSVLGDERRESVVGDTRAFSQAQLPQRVAPIPDGF